MKKLFLLWALFCAASLGYAADTKISDLSAGSALAGTEAIPAVQSSATVKTTPAALSTYIESQLTSADVISKFSGTCNGTVALLGDGSCAAPPLPSTITGSKTFTGALAFQNGIDIFSSVVKRQQTPSQLSTTNNNYSFISGFGCCLAPVYRLEAASGGSTITGMALTAGDFYRVTLVNISTTDTITFTNEGGGSSAGNRILTPNGASFVLQPLAAADFWYDATGTSRWRIVNVAASSSSLVTAFATISNAGTCNLEVGSGVSGSVSHPGPDGQCNLLFTATFTTTPVCVASQSAATPTVFATVTSASTSGVTVITADSVTATPIDSNFNIICQGT